MREVKISGLHCSDCKEDLITKLENMTGLSGFAYDESIQMLRVPEEANLGLIEDILNADKITICHNGQDAACPCLDCTEHLSEAPSIEAHDHEHGHEHAHSHGHHHGHSHAHGPVSGDSVRNISIVFAMNLLFSIAEFIFGAILNSTAIFADAVHDLGDALSVGLAFFLEKRSKKHPDKHYSFGHRRFSLLGALITGLVLVLGSLFSLTRALPRLFAPQPVHYEGMLVMAIVAILMNGVSAWALSRGHSRNEGMLNLHMLEDMLGWVGILILSIILRFQPWYFLDPLVSIGISLFILWNALPTMWSTLKILMESVPEYVNLEDLENQLLALPGVHGLSHLHLWSMDGESNNFAVTLFTDADTLDKQKALRQRVRLLIAPLHVQCSTIELDYDPDKLFAKNRKVGEGNP